MKQAQAQACDQLGLHLSFGGERFAPDEISATVHQCATEVIREL
eukprot:CAMPEP_0174760898 /NCGR_PEP_ID=MMETSP1094-20130205/109003_1 /TAXON_ID=156173 /ORGANISM="Chrysochromulina brevifilum, Strain UTEX LB 985" /LENGTH=43 /DNA_ID= /DNA_START= /DNA_END= /DNA_ORIENTATION=